MSELTTGPFQKMRQTAQIIGAARKAKKSGLLVKGMTPDEVQDAIVAQLLGDDPKTYGDPKFDWSSLIALIVELLPIIMALFGL